MWQVDKILISIIKHSWMFRMLVDVAVYINAKTDSTVGAGENKFLFYILVSAKITVKDFIQI